MSFIFVKIVIVLYHCILNQYTMAILIKQAPILYGQIALDFIREAEENEKLLRCRLYSEDEATIRRVMREMEEFVTSGSARSNWHGFFYNQ